MPIERIFIARHGFRLNWQNTTWSSPTGLARDITLTAYGEIQAAALAQHIASLPEDERPTAIFSSAWYRCIQTSLPVAQALNIPIYIDQGMGEWFSPAAPGTGLHPRPGPTSSLIQYFPPGTIDPRYEITSLPSRRGENVAEIHARISTFLTAFFTRFDLAEQGRPIKSDKELDLAKHKNIMLVGHAASVIALARVLSGERDLAMRAGCCSLSILVPKSDAKRSSYSTPSRSATSHLSSDSSGTIHESESTRITPIQTANARVGEWSLIQNATADFLPNGSERDWGFEDVELAGGEVVNDIGEPDMIGEIEEPSERGLQIEFPPDVARQLATRLAGDGTSTSPFGPTSSAQMPRL